MEDRAPHNEVFDLNQVIIRSPTLEDLHEILEGIRSELALVLATVKRPSIPKPLLTETDVAKMFQVESATVRKWRYEGTGPRYSKLGKLVRYRPEDVEEFVQQHLKE